MTISDAGAADTPAPIPPGSTGSPPPPPVVARFSGWPPPPPPPPYRPRRVQGLLVLAAVLLLTVTGIAAVSPRHVAGHASAMPGATRPASAGVADPEPQPRLADNALLAAGNAPVAADCTLPALGSAPDQLEAFYLALVACLAKAWQPALDRAHEPGLDVKVSVRLPDHSLCGKAPSKDEAVAYYCGGDKTIYAPADWMLADAGTNRARHLATIAHEYGHHVQRESGILDAATKEMTSSDPKDPADLAVVRRIELQANCFGALFLAEAAGHGSISRALANAAVADYGRSDDSTSHGTRAHQISWAQAGYQGRTTAACNTWSAAASDVT